MGLHQIVRDLVREREEPEAVGKVKSSVG